MEYSGRNLNFQYSLIFLPCGSSSASGMLSSSRLLPRDMAIAGTIRRDLTGIIKIIGK